MSMLTVTVPAASHNLTSLLIVKDELDITDSSQDARLTRWIGEASEQIKRFVNRVLISETVAETFLGDSFGMDRGCSFNGYPAAYDNVSRRATYRLLASRFPISAIASIVIDGGDPLETSDYTYDAERGCLYLPYWTGTTVVVTYTGGYALAETSGIQTLPGSIVQAATALVCLRHATRGRDPSLRSVDIPGVLSESYWVAGGRGEDGAMPPSVAGLIEGFREVRP